VSGIEEGDVDDVDVVTADGGSATVFFLVGVVAPIAETTTAPGRRLVERVASFPSSTQQQ
jgi:hypothetical protein